jgi:hypothetical protein
MMILEMKDRLTVALKWSVILIVLAVIVEILVFFIARVYLGIVSSESSNNRSANLLVNVIAMIGVLPLIYYCCYKAVIDYLQHGKNRFEKGVGLRISMGVFFFTFLISILLTYLLTGTLNLSLGFLPLILCIVAGRQAESKYAKGRK